MKDEIDMPCASLIPLPSSLEQLFRQHHRSAFHFVLGCLDLCAQRGAVADVDGLAKSEILVVGHQNGDRASIARKNRPFPADLTLGDELAHVGGQIEELELL